MSQIKGVVKRIYTAPDPKDECRKVAQERGFVLDDQTALFPEPEQNVLWKDCPLSDKKKFAHEFQDLAAVGVDVMYYYETINDWATSKRSIRRTNWVGVVKNWIRRDDKNGKLKLTFEANAERQTKELADELAKW